MCRLKYGSKVTLNTTQKFVHAFSFRYYMGKPELCVMLSESGVGDSPLRYNGLMIAGYDLVPKPH